MLVLVAVASLLQSLTFGYVFDDTYAILGMRRCAVGPRWDGRGESSSAVTAVRSLVCTGPVTMTLFAILFDAGAKWPLWFQVAALALHAGAAVLVWRLLRRAMGLWPAYIAALWFAVHPVHVTSPTSRTRPRCSSPSGPRSLRSSCFSVARWRRSGAMAAPVAALLVWGGTVIR